MRHEHKTVILHRFSGLLRTRVILCLIGMFVMYKQPLIAQYITGLIGMALGVSAIDAYKFSPKKEDSNGQ